MCDPLTFWHENLGRFLKVSNDPWESITKTYAVPGKEKQQRMTDLTDDAALIGADWAILKSNIVPECNIPDGVQIKPRSWRNAREWRDKIILSPPKPPFMFVVFTKSHDISLTVNYGRDIITTSGPKPETYNRAIIISAIDAIGEMKWSTVGAAKYAEEDAAFYGGNKMKKYLAIDNAVRVVAAKLPGTGTTEFKLIGRAIANGWKGETGNA